jgi:hypothetical protein
MARSLPASRNLKLALPKTSIGPATSSDCAVGVARTTIFRAGATFRGPLCLQAIFSMLKI